MADRQRVVSQFQHHALSAASERSCRIGRQHPSQFAEPPRKEAPKESAHAG
jgi:hypothetical protein